MRNSVVIFSAVILVGAAVHASDYDDFTIYEPHHEPSYYADGFCYPVFPVAGTRQCAVYPEEPVDRRIRFRNDSGFLEKVGQKYHLGEDWNGFTTSPQWDPRDDYGLPVYSAANCVVIWVNDWPNSLPHSWGKTLLAKCKLPSGVYIYPAYAHLSEISRTVGDQIMKGQQIGRIGDGGGYYNGGNCDFNQRCPHLHFELRSSIDLNPNARLFGSSGYAEDRSNPEILDYVNPLYPGGGPTSFIEDYGGFEIPGGANSCLVPRPNSLCGGMGGGDSRPIVISTGVDSLTEISATFFSKVNPNALETTCSFHWDDDPTFDWTTSGAVLSESEDSQSFSETVPVICNKEYFLKTVCENGAGESSGSVVTFRAPRCTGTNPPETFELLFVQLDDCRMEGQYERFSDGTGGRQLHTLRHKGPGTHGEFVRFHVFEAGQYNGPTWWHDWSPPYSSETYDYEFVVENEYGSTTSSNTVSITIPPECGTMPSAPSVETLATAYATDNGATLRASVTPNGSDTNLAFEWGETSLYGNTTTTQPVVGLGHESHEVAQTIGGLSCGTYHFRPVATNAYGTSYGEDRTFVTDCGSPPITEGEMYPQAHTVSLWHMDGPPSTARKVDNAEGTSDYDLWPVGGPTADLGFNGEPDGSFRLDGPGQYLDLPYLPAPENHDLTWMGWVYAEVPRSNPLVAYVYPHHSAPRAYMTIQETGIVEVRFSEAFPSPLDPNPAIITADLESSGSIGYHRWQHVALTRESGLYRLYLNGVLDAEYDTGSNNTIEVTTQSPLPIENGWISLGRAGASDTQYFKGLLDEWHILQGLALSAGEISEYYAEASLFTPPPVNGVPSLEILSPQEGTTVDRDLLIAWGDLDLEDDATISFGWSTNSDCSSSTTIISGLSEDDEAAVYVWDTSALPNGNYYLQGRIDDGANPPVEVCSGPVSVQHAEPTNSHALNLERDNGQYVFITDAAQTGLDFSGDLTLECWVNFESDDVEQVLLSKYRLDTAFNDQRSYLLRVAASKSLDFVVSETGNIVADELNYQWDFQTGVWYHVAAVFSAAQPSVRLLIDGLVVAERAISTASIHEGAASFAIGVQGNGVGAPEAPLDGLIDEVRVWSYARAQEEIVADLRSELAGTEEELIGYWPFNGDLLDRSANGNHLSDVGGPVFASEIPWDGQSGMTGENTPPTLSLVEPDGFQDITDETFIITWIDEDADDDAQITLLWSMDALCESTTVIAGGISEDDEVDSYSWETVELPAGAYYVQSIIDDGSNTPSEACAGPIEVSHETSTGNTHSLDFELDNGQYAYVTDSDQSGLDLTGDLTIEAWIKPESENTEGWIANKFRLNAGVGHRAYGFWISADESLNFTYSTDGHGQNTTQVPWGYTANTWYHVAVTHDISDNEVRFFVDGNLMGTMQTSSGSSMFDSVASFAIGCNGSYTGSPGNYFDGKIDDVRVWNYERYPGEILFGMGEELSGSEPGLVGYWSLNGDLEDYSGNGNHLTPVGNSSFSNSTPF